VLGVVLAVVVAALAWDTDTRGVPAVAGRCAIAGSALTLTTEQAANAATIAAVARVRGLPERAVVIALATAQQESRLRNLPYGDRDSLGLFQQRPSQGWGTPAQVQDPVYAANRFYDGLVQVPDWRSGRLTSVADAVQRSAFPEAYQQHEEMAEELAGALSSDDVGAVDCRYSPPSPAGPVGDRTAAVAASVRQELGGRPALGPGTVALPDAGGPESAWAVAHAERLQLVAVEAGGRRWTADGGWADAPGAGAGGVVLTLAG
jgi:hypothetical protein